MTVKFDPHQHTLSLSVGDLCSEPAGSGSLNLVPMRDLRGELGREVHQEYQSARRAAFPGYRTEVPLGCELQVDGCRVTIQGRLDGVYRDRQGWVVEEIKSRLGPVEAGEESPVVPAHLLQLKVYVHLWMKTHAADDVRGRLVVISCSDRSSHCLEVESDPPAMDRFLEMRIREILARLQPSARREEARGLPPLRFPYPRMRKGQAELVESIEEALQSSRPLLVSAPTGIGKTVAALYAALRFSRRHGLSVFFLTSKTTQQRIVADTLSLWEEARSEEDGSGRPFTGLVLRSKEKICANDVVCCHPSRCAYARDFYGKLESSDLRSSLADFTVITPDLVYQSAVENEICPFELSVELLPEADLVLCDYNYLYDPRISLKRRFSGDSRAAVVIIDEAHNLYGRARDYYSPRLDLGRVRSLKRKMQALAGMADASQAAIEFGSGERAGNAGGEDAAFARDVVDCLSRLESYFGEIRADFRESSEGNPFPVRLDRPFFDDLGDRLHDLLRRYLLDPKRRAVPRGEDEFLEMARGLEEFRTVLEIGGEEFVHLYDETGKSHQLRILCLNPALQLRERHRTFHSVVAMSATLSPLEFYRDVLGFEPDAMMLSLPSPFPPDNRKVVVVPEVSTRYRHRAETAPRVGRIIERVVAVRPGNYLAFFPSFEFLGGVRPFLRPDGYRLLVQKRTMGDHSRNALLEELASSDQPHLLLGVQGGIFAEGVDYPGDLAIGVIIVGPALPRVGRELDLTRQYFEEQYGRGFEYACLFPGMNRVVQSAGRVIRSETDRGVIVLVGQRFGYENYMSLFPGDWYESSPSELVSGAFEDELTGFWGERQPAGDPGFASPSPI
ncbi:MAG: hypothetical protein F4X19_09020 [Acidobacteria bacterium]|nr:hypothetical protein [Acidobacteriota bacterium]